MLNGVADFAETQCFKRSFLVFFASDTAFQLCNFNFSGHRIIILTVKHFINGYAALLGDGSCVTQLYQGLDGSFYHVVRVG